jgi:3-methyladenine DNA glycosylase AlkC
MEEQDLSTRVGARKISDVPAAVLERLAMGEIETVNLMEWLAADMPALARCVAYSLPGLSALQSDLLEAAEAMKGVGVTERLRAAGAAIARNARSGSAEFRAFAEHKSDLVRQWACYAVNDSLLGLTVSERLDATLPFAADRNMSVRETAWMAFRPHLAGDFETVLPLLTDLAAHPGENIRRFAVEVTRPRSVWGAHLARLKRDPGTARELLEQVRADSSKYVKLAVGNWLNDASKSRPDWVIATCERWAVGGNPHTRFIVRRGLRTLAANDADAL